MEKQEVSMGAKASLASSIPLISAATTVDTLLKWQSLSIPPFQEVAILALMQSRQRLTGQIFEIEAQAQCSPETDIFPQTKEARLGGVLT